MHISRTGYEPTGSGKRGQGHLVGFRIKLATSLWEKGVRFPWSASFE
jgi:hypothetical protein